ncbi:MAG: radical SAM protein [Anaerolineales bacterium]|nr:radical SAM protein [Anaerolineales bacterium]
MSTSTRNYWKNLGKLFQGNRLLHPLVVSYYPTTYCNFNCAYCEDFGARRNPQAVEPLPLTEAQQVLRVIRSGVDKLIFTGGEPLLYPHIDALILFAKQELGFRQLTILTNGSLLHDHEAALPHLDRVVISLDTTDKAHWESILNVSAGTIDTVFANLESYAKRQGEFGYQMMVNCVVTPGTLAEAAGVLDFCLQHNILVSFSPQAVNNWPHYDLLVDDAYKAFLARLIDLKKSGAPILGSMAYLQTLLEFKPYSCHPTLVPRIASNGDLLYPCRPIEREGTRLGGRPCNLLEVTDWDEAIRIADQEYGPPPRLCTSCFQQCYAEASLMQEAPLQYLAELIRYPTSRKAGLITYAPG